jgi:hypothetical protein
MWFIVLIFLPGILLLIFFIVYAICDLLRRKSVIYEDYDFQFHNTNMRPKIGAEVSTYFYDEVKRYCRKHNMSISDLIRESVKSYMDTNR